MEGMSAYEIAVKGWLDVTATEDAELNAVYDGSEAQAKKCFAYIEKEVRKLAGGKTCYVATDDEVYELARKYFVEVYLEEEKKEAERKEKAEAEKKKREEAQKKKEEEKQKEKEAKEGFLGFDFGQSAPSASAEVKLDTAEEEEPADDEADEDEDSCEEEQEEEELEIF